MRGVGWRDEGVHEPASGDADPVLGQPLLDVDHLLELLLEDLVLVDGEAPPSRLPAVHAEVVLVDVGWLGLLRLLRQVEEVGVHLDDVLHAVGGDFLACFFC
jgi:hypothetical protein